MSRTLNKVNFKYKIWVDEAWRWSWAWPVVACALCFNPESVPNKNFLIQLNDSKKLTSKKREKLYESLIEMSCWDIPKVFFGVWVVDNYTVDEINIKKANREAMRRALIELLRKIDDSKIDSILIDGNDNYNFGEIKKQPIFIIQWDKKITEIWAASIIAKVFRDKLMTIYSSLYPKFSFNTNFAYGTKKHKESLKEKSDIIWIHRLSYKPVKEVLEKKPKLLLHVCCWPDATVPIMDLKRDYKVICFWYDPNIQPKSEYDKRLKAFKKICKIESVKWMEWEYDVKNFFNKIKWLEHTPEKWEKCNECYDMRLERTALEAKKLGIKYWTSTLNTSPHKDLEKLFKLWDKHSMKQSLKFLKIAFRKNKGFERSVEYTKKHKIYRQNYCWCIYSDTFPKKFKK